MDIKKTLYKLLDELASNISPNNRASFLGKVQNLNLTKKDISVILDYARQPPPKAAKARSVLEVLDQMGFPENKDGLTYVVSIASDPNSPNWELAQAMIVKLGAHALPEIREALRLYSQYCDEGDIYLQGLCQLLEGLPPSVIRHTLPELFQLIEQGTDKNYIDEYALYPIKKLGSPYADKLIPKLVDIIIANDRSIRIKSKCVNALKSFNPGTIKHHLQQMQSNEQNFDNQTIALINELADWVENNGNT